MMRVILADDHVLVRAGIRTLLENNLDVDVLAEATDGQEAVKLSRQLQPDLVLMDIAMPGLNGIDAASRIRQQNPQINIIILSMYSDDIYVDRALRAGASAYLLKDSATEELKFAVNAVQRGEIYLCPRVSRRLMESYLNGGMNPAPVAGKPAPEGGEFKKKDVLTTRQREVLQLVAEGMTSRQISEKLSLSIKTVEAHRSNIQQRLGISDMPSLVRYAIRHGLVPEN